LDIHGVYYPKGVMPNSQPDTSQTPKATILLVDDDPNDRELMRVLLTREYEVIEAADGNEALSHFEKHQDRIHLLLTDVHMPGMDGVELAKKILTINPSIKILFASGFRHNFASDIDGHPVGFIEKTPELPNFSQKVKEVLFPTNPIKKLWNAVSGMKD
jgi:two-component system cell cycle sensor histidine kinase/response regulator CckA